MIPTTMTLKQLQESVREMYTKRGFDKASATTLALGAAEEIGEVAQAVLITVTPDFTPSAKKLSPEWEDCRDVASEVGDTITYLLALCNKMGIQPKFKWIKEPYET